MEEAVEEVNEEQADKDFYISKKHLDVLAS
jgi:hypothetical protein